MRFKLLAACALAILVPIAGHASPPADAVVERDGSGALMAKWSSPDPVDVFVSIVPEAKPDPVSLVSAADLDGRQAIAETAAARSYVVLRNSRTGELVRVAERVLPLEAGSNFRDIGGYTAADGKRVRWGRIYRSGATPLLTTNDLQRIRSLGLVDMVDLRSSEERVLAPSRIEGIEYSAVGYSMASLNVQGGMDATYRNLPGAMAPQLRMIFARLARNEQPLAYNCSAGQDRTGFVTAMILSALGVDRQTILADYHLSTIYRHPEYEMPKLDPAQAASNPVAAMFIGYQNEPHPKPQPLYTAEGKPFLDIALEQIRQKWGSVDGYLAQEVGLKPADIERLRGLYLE